jgi:ABC-type nitrate/sulfonate/bicarbonate transport system ATPase subunit
MPPETKRVAATRIMTIYQVPKAMQEKYSAIVAQTDQFAAKYLNAEYQQLVNRAIAALCRKKPSPLVSGSESSWAAADSHFQFFHLLPTLTAEENIALPLHLLGVAAPERRRRVQGFLERIGLTHRAAALPAQLSGGEQQRIAIARALIHQPDLILADEPTGNLDSVNGANILALLRELTDETRTALILVTHSEEAAAICQNRIHLRDGRIVERT